MKKKDRVTRTFGNFLVKNKHKYLVVSKFLTTFAPAKPTWCP